MVSPRIRFEDEVESSSSQEPQKKAKIGVSPLPTVARVFFSGSVILGKTYNSSWHRGAVALCGQNNSEGTEEISITLGDGLMMNT